VQRRDADAHDFNAEGPTADTHIAAGRELEGLAPKTITDLRWSLTNHLLPHFADYPLSAITPQEVDRYTRSRRFASETRSSRPRLAE
jgi:hypothetical protein